MDQRVIILLEKYLNGSCTANELRQIRQILQEDRYKEEWDKVLKNDAEKLAGQSQDETNLDLEPHQVELLLQRIRTTARIEKPGQAVAHSYWKWVAVAASIAIILTVGMAFFVFSNYNGKDLIAVSTQAGEQQNITLPDGSQIRLGNASTIRYNAAFGPRKREVYLTGKAYFKVVHNAAKPFVVHTKQLTIRDLGTAFGIRSYKNDKAAVVLVAEGKVSVSSANGASKKPLGILLPGEQLAYNLTSDGFTQQTVADEGIVAWSQGKLVFYNQPLGDILRAIERRYEVTVRLQDDAAKDKRITFKQNSRALEDVLKVLSLVSGLQYEIDNQVVIMK